MMKMGKNLILTISYKDVDDPVIAELGVIAARERKSRSELIMNLIEQYVKSHAEGNETFKLDNWNLDPEFQAVPAYLSNRDKWVEHYKSSSDKDRTKLRIQAIDLQKLFRMVDVNYKEDNQK